MIRRSKLITLIPVVAGLVAAARLAAQAPVPSSAVSEVPAGYAAASEPQPVPLPPVESSAPPFVSGRQPDVSLQHVAGYQASGVGDRYAVPAVYQAAGSIDRAVVQVSAQSEILDISRELKATQTSNAEVAPAEFLTAEPSPLPPAQPPADLAGSAAIPIPRSTTFRLEELVGIAVSQNPILRRERAKIEQAKGERVQAGLYENPVFFTNNPQIWAGQASFVNVGYYQVVQTKGKLRIDKAAADQLVRRNTADYRLEYSDMLTEVRKQYYKTLAAKHRIYLAQHLAALAERGVSSARKLEQAGEGTLTDVLLLDTEYQRELIGYENARTIYRGELKQLAAIVGASGMVIDDIEGTLFDAPPVFDEQDAKQFILTNSSYAERARADLVHKQAKLRRAEVEPYPNFRIGPHYVTGTQPTSSQFWFTVEFDIPTWNLNQGNIRKRSAEVHNSMAARESTNNELDRQLSELFAEHRAARQRAERIRVEILPNAQEAQRLVQDAYVKGQFNVNRLLKSQQNLAAVASEYFEAAEKSWDTAAEIAGYLQLEQFP